MPMTEEQIDAIDQAIPRLQADKYPLVTGLRELFPGIVFVRCAASDMEGNPYRSGGRHRLYLLDRSEMCIQLTDRLEKADGVVVAEAD